MHKSKYEIDPHNRLVRLHNFRRVLSGKFKTGKNNTLIYSVNDPFPRGAKIPHQVKLRGKWSLSGRRRLTLTLDKRGRRASGDKLTLTGDIVRVDKDTLFFAVSTQTKKSTRSTYCLKLKGSWRADRHNRLTFRVKKEHGRHDILILDGIWEVNRHHQVIYRYEKAHLIRKSKKIHTLVFKGHWNITDDAGISYVFDGNTKSKFSFKTSARIFRKNYIKYKIGIGLSRKAPPVGRTVTLFGSWKVRRGKELAFEIKYKNGKIHAIVFSADMKLTSGDTVLFRLRSESGRDLSANVKLSRGIMKGNGQAYVKGLKSRKEAAVYAGAVFGW